MLNASNTSSQVWSSVCSTAVLASPCIDRGALITDPHPSIPAILYYDYILTFQEEVTYIWCQRFRISTILYIMCRYALIANVVYLFAVADKLSVRVFVWGMRTYAVYDRNPTVGLVLGVMAIATLCADIVCVLKRQTRGVLAIFMCIFEVTSAILTIVRILQAMKAIGPWRLQKASLNYLLFEQGKEMLRSSVTSLSVAALTLNYKEIGFIQRLLNGLKLPISGLMTARFLLHLRRWDYKRSRPSQVSINIIDIESGARMDPQSFVEEFGEDPMQVVRETAGDEIGDTMTDENMESPVATAFIRSPTLRIRQKPQTPTSFPVAGPSSRQLR
ncbi:hypothetical protein K443DRAFT_635993 [Laccaria amethystina LaAM-08-1]|uniref:DUF6533 domain-containing protein n=1 Tax=Laccaria amethystina LaAM-08-1 TaxID=1095629 RepID=A0A0C9X488_9AGAR|nr:hypothetical protein K443DRAFT_635993 [Laccaria amethystina LaAM-08-1]